jgi:hypothetical protein
MKLFHITTSLLLLCVLVPIDSLHACENGTLCKAMKSGNGSHPTRPTNCLVKISAPTYGGEVGLDIRDAAGNSIWPKPRIKMSGPGIFVTYIGCSQLDRPTTEAYLCVDGTRGNGDGKHYHSIRSLESGALTMALQTHHLDMCLKGAACPNYVGQVGKK